MGNGLQHHMPGTATAYISGPGIADQLADALNATHLSVSPPQVSNVTSCMGPACMVTYSSSSGGVPVSPPNSAAAAAIAAGQRFFASPAASPASSAEFHVQQPQVVAVSTGLGQAAVNGVMPVATAGLQYQVMAPGPVMLGPDGQTVYYMTPPQVS
jgi:hypothetical protein